MAIAVSAWFLAALVAGAAGVLDALPPPFPQAVVVAVVVALLAALRLSEVFRTWAMTVDLRVLVLVHVSRLVGLYVLVLAGRGELPASWAVPAGWGDVVVALLALALVLFVPLDTRGGRAALLAWNVLSLVDILLVVAGVARIALADPYAMRPLLWLPLALLPTFLVPLIIFTHVLLFARLLGTRGS
ncbi:MAG TPA: hypothetical protein VFX28_15490 [Methylomirabilota bacterium]|nr:hypothetical protein [Methylomirabilota bacterium]